MVSGMAHYAKVVGKQNQKDVMTIVNNLDGMKNAIGITKKYINFWSLILHANQRKIKLRTLIKAHNGKERMDLGFNKIRKQDR